jgi:multiple antibiotic resistance protein
MSEAQNVLLNIDAGTGIIAISGVYIGIAVTLVVSYFMMSRSENIDKRLKEGGRRVVTRLMGLLVMAIAVQFIINGIKDVLPEFLEIAGNSTAFFGL